MMKGLNILAVSAAIFAATAVSSCDQKDNNAEEQTAGIVNIEKGVVPAMWTPESEPIQAQPVPENTVMPEEETESAEMPATEQPQAPQPAVATTTVIPIVPVMPAVPPQGSTAQPKESPKETPKAEAPKEAPKEASATTATSAEAGE